MYRLVALNDSITQNSFDQPARVFINIRVPNVYSLCCIEFSTPYFSLFRKLFLLFIFVTAWILVKSFSVTNVMFLVHRRFLLNPFFTNLINVTKSKIDPFRRTSVLDLVTWFKVLLDLISCYILQIVRN